VIKFEPKKIESIKEWQRLMCAKDVKSLLGLVNFYRKFIKDLLTSAKPFTNLLKKEGSIRWKGEQQKAFDLLKGKLSLALVLRFSKPFEVHI
jgi:hypothetical protein